MSTSAISLELSPEKLRKARGSRTQLFVAQTVGITRQYLSKIESGECTPGGDILVKLCAFYDVELSELTQTNGKKRAA